MLSASVKDVAALAGVSVGTVSNVLNRPEKVSPAVMTKVQMAIEKLGFVRNDAARQLRAGMSHSIGLVVLDAANPFFTDLARGAEDSAAAKGFSVLVGNSSDDERREASYLGLFEQQRVLGILLSPVGDILSRLEQLRRRGIPTVLVDRVSDNASFSSVGVDNVAGGEMAVRHLLSLGRRRIVFVGGPSSIRQVADRLTGARKAIKEVFDATLEVIEPDSLTVLSGRAAGEAIRNRPVEERPDAIFAANDLLAVGILQALMLMGTVQVPQEIALIGYDDIEFASAAVVPLSSIRQPSALIGSTALELLLQEVSAEPGFKTSRVVFPPELVVRASTRG
ncbi:LacI family DNA-binding transcriptional regulator [Arthrobacter cryoconiti]|uniref:LacI family DNA-binding transcriptional regulator n=1 Tax=Arthrobacter cryoconiti TaxID=748907 RepID=A0ABV8QYR5_9MICC|nr:LacI family DNA-binding transcriptional regulator [Arthrobacter cryoconiti]MCC9067519.1 LacI family transcriptional regulator [Arthrobacter cryoconiti]